MTHLHGVRGHLIAASFLRSEIAGAPSPEELQQRRLRILRSLARADALGPASSPRSILDTLLIPLLDALGLGAPFDLDPSGDVIAATVGGPVLVHPASPRTSSLAIVVTRWGERLDRHWRTAVTQARRRNASWSLTCNGVSIRVVDATRLYLRRFTELDLAAPLDDDVSLASLWRIAAGPSLLSDPMQPRSLHALVARSERYGATVCRSLRDGVLAASEQVLRALVAGSRSSEQTRISDTFEQALTIVYRVVFLLYAEARGLVPLWHPVYRESYSIESLREAAEHGRDSPGLWDALRAIARLAHTGCVAGDLKVTPFNGRLFAPARTPLGERRGLDDEAARCAVLALSTRPAPDRAGREPIAYAELDVEQLGSVYETLLDYEPRVVSPLAAPHRHRRFEAAVTLEAGSGVRKATGTFYTPQAIADHLVRRALAPLVRNLDPDAILRLRILDPAMGSGAFLVSACRYIAGVYEEAMVAHGRCHPNDIDEIERASIRRLVAERCLYGVDLNPMAVQLARLSLWLATLAGDRPLSFLDHRLVVGDSLLGVWLTQLRRPPVPRRRRSAATLLPLFGDQTASGALREALPLRFSLEAIPDDTVEQVRAKERAFAALCATGSPLARWKRVANLWCAAWFDGGPPAASFDALADFVLTGTSALPSHLMVEHLARADAVAATQRFLHWELEFPEVFFDEHGRRLARPGFDAVIGNPPWDMMRDDATRDTDRANSGRSAASTVVGFTRTSGAYSAQSDGHANRYQLFTERAVALTRGGGRFGLVLPSGLAADSGSGALREMLFSRCRIDAIVGVDNRRRIFPIHRSLRFLLLTGTAGSSTERFGLRLGIERVEDLQAMEDAPASALPIQLTQTGLERLSGPALAIPDLRQPIDVVILDKATSLFEPLGSTRGWHARFGRELNATDDRAAFRADRRGLPIVDGRHLDPFHVALDRSTRSIGVSDARRILGASRFDRSRLAYRDVAAATNRTTLISAILPPDCVSTHTVFCLRTPLSVQDQRLLCGLFNSLVVNYLVRLRVSTHVTTAIVEQLPIPTRDAAPRACREIVALARLLSRRPGAEAMASLNAWVAGLYQLTVAEFEYVLSTFPLVEIELRRRALALFVETQSHRGAQR